MNHHIRNADEEAYREYIKEVKELYKTFVETLNELPKEQATVLAYDFALSNYLPMCGSLTEH